MSASRRANRWRGDLQLIHENIRWMEKAGALQLGFGVSIEFVAVAEFMVDSGPVKDIMKPYLCMSLLLCGLCVIVCGFLSRGMRMWKTCGFMYACLMVNCMCLTILLLPLGFIHGIGSLFTLVSQKRVNITEMESAYFAKNDIYIVYINGYLYMYYIGNLLLMFCVALSGFQANVCCLTISFRERELCYASMFIKFGFSLFQGSNRISQ